ncbi:TlpA disulfide reductase family protein [uncultured Polaribacter sp.]|uniref:TlpA family protein disulfide reductase n=1 Tax=uncultured Polaribacter sp. TaxID=174711 RepID=UPI00260FDFAA|nr:TlpA disulfide reductase family protein [uncultured Polaribacter sp.]
MSTEYIALNKRYFPYRHTLPHIRTKMKLKKILLAILVIGLIGCQNKKKEVIINIKVNGKYPEKIEYTTPIDGKWFYGDKKAIIIDSIGTLQIKMDVEKPSFMTMYASGKAAILLVEPGNTYNTEFEFETKQKKFLVTSDYSIGQNFYNTFTAPDFNLWDLNAFMNDSIPSEIASKINDLKEKEIFKFNELLEKGEISSPFHELAVLDRKVYYSALEIRVATMLLSAFSKENNFTATNQVKDFWNEKVNNLLLNESEYTRSPWFYTLIDNLIDYSSNDSVPKLSNGKIYKYKIDEIKKYLKGNELEYYTASYIFLECWQSKDNSKELISVYKNYKREYPNSRYIEYLTAAVKPIIDFQSKISDSTINKKIKLVENYKSIDTFDELIKSLHGKKVFVDIWGTWCGPCKREFQQKDKYSEILKSNNITTLYICEGRVSKEKVWKEMINFYDLEGQHILANKKLLADIISRFGNNGNFAYPWYLLVDENGNVVNKRASYPSKIEQLEKEINENYVW